MNQTKFALYNFSGKPTAFFRVEEETLASDAVTQTRQPSHHIIIVDRSGSMYGDINDLKGTVEKLLTLQEFNDPSLRVSLLSYSSKGDVKIHFAKVTVADVMASNSTYLQEIRNIRVTGLTCISQSLETAATLIDDKDITCISLHTDGYANDMSPSSEARGIQAAVDTLRKRPNTFVNTVAHRDWCDFNLLSGISNQLSGVCIQAKNIRQVYEALHNTTALLAGSLSPVVEAPIGKASYVMFLSRKAKKVLGSRESMVVRGLASSDDKTIYRLYPVSEAEYEAIPGSLNVDVAAAYCRTQIAQGNINAAKYALVATRHKMLTTHARALVASEVAAFASEVEEFLFDQYSKYDPFPTYGLPSSGPSVLSVLGVLSQFKNGFRLNLSDFQQTYKRRGLKRVAGVRQDDGTLVEPLYDLVNVLDSSGLAEVSSFDFNRNTATVNMLVTRPGRLVEKATSAVIDEVAGVKLDKLRSFNNYTLVGDGQVTSPTLPIRISDKRLHKALVDIGATSGDYSPTETVILNLGTMPVVDYDQSFDIPQDIYGRLLNLTVMSKILSGIVKGESESLTGEQIAELKKYHLTPSLNFSPPTTNAYTDLTEALNRGEVDTRLSYKVEVGSPEITSVSKLKSGNEYLQRRFTVTVGGQEVEKPTLDLFLDPTAVFGLKKLSARTTLDAVDNVSFPVYEAFLGFNPQAVAQLTGLSINDRSSFESMSADDRLAYLNQLRSNVDFFIEGIYRSSIIPLAFYVGSTGLVPDSFDAPALTAEQVEQRFPTIKLAKAEKEEGTFFPLSNGLLLTVYVKGEHFSVT